MRILYILRHNPWGIGGGCYACRNYLEAFTEVFKDAEFDILLCEEYLASCDSRVKPQNVNFIGVPPRTSFSRALIPLTKIMHRHQSKAIEMLGYNKYEYCIFDDNCIAGSLVRVCKKQGVKTVVINHNCEFEYFRDNIKGIKQALLLPVVKHNERVSYHECNYNIFLTTEDEQIFKSMYGETKAVNIIGGCFISEDEVLPVCGDIPLNADSPKIVISGTIGNVQNIDGINYFLEELYDILPKEAEVIIAGKHAPSSLLERLKNYTNITLISNPADILSIVKECDVFLCPTRLGGGMKLRVMDGLKCGIPVLAHDVSSRGYSAFFASGYFEHFSNKKEFATKVNILLSNIKKRNISRIDIQNDAQNIWNFSAAVARLKIIKFGK